MSVVYFAGKLGKGDYRVQKPLSSWVNTTRNIRKIPSPENDKVWGVSEILRLGGRTSGPIIRKVGGDYEYAASSPDHAWSLCKAAMRSAQLVFAWVDDWSVGDPDMLRHLAFAEGVGCHIEVWSQERVENEITPYLEATTIELAISRALDQSALHMHNIRYPWRPLRNQYTGKRCILCHNELQEGDDIFWRRVKGVIPGKEKEGKQRVWSECAHTACFLRNAPVDFLSNEMKNVAIQGMREDIVSLRRQNEELLGRLKT